MSARLLLRVVALVALLVAVARVVSFSVLHDAPATGVEAADLQRAMFYHWGLLEHREWSWLEQVRRDAYKPPLWFGGVPLLAAGRETLDHGLFLCFNAVVLVALAAAAWRLAGSLSGGPLAGPLAAALVVGLPGTLGRFTMAGVEPLHAALLLAWLLALRRLRSPGLVGVVAGGLVLAAGLLSKWTFGAYAAAPLLWELGVALRTGNRRAAGRVCMAGALATACFAPWWLGAAEGRALLAAASAEPTFVGDPWGAALYYPRVLASYLGPAGVGASLLAVALWRQERSVSAADLGLLGTAAAVVLVVHAVIPHREARYLVPMLGPIAVLVAVALAAWASRRGAVPALAVVLLPPALALGLGAREPSLRLHPTPADADLDRVLRHPSFEARDRSIVTYALDVPPASGPQAALDWALYGRNERAVLGRGNHPDLTERAAAFDLERSTHVVVGRELLDQERAALASMGFEPTAARASGAAIGLGDLSLWALPEGRSPPRSGPGPGRPP